MEVIVGRQGNQRMAITDKAVSRQHCKLTSLGDGMYCLENLSSNGTFIDGRDVIKTVVTSETEIRLGGRFACLVKDLLPLNIEDRDVITMAGSDMEEKFLRLEKIDSDYHKEKVRIQQEASKVNFMRTVPGMVTGIVFAVTMVLGASPIVNVLRVLTGIGSASMIAFSAVKAYKTQSDTPEKVEMLNKRFQIDYVCPKCGNFLGFLPFELLKNRNQCTYCKTKWIK